MNSRARRLRHDPRFTTTPVIAISASVFPLTRQESLAAGCDDFLTKPVHFDTLLDCLHAYLDIVWQYHDERRAQDVATPSDIVPINPPSQTELQQLFTWAMVAYATRL